MRSKLNASIETTKIRDLVTFRHPGIPLNVRFSTSRGDASPNVTISSNFGGL